MKDRFARERFVPPELKDVLPPHPIEFVVNDTDAGRECLRCGFSVPGGYKHVHYEWCEAREPTWPRKGEHETIK